MAVPGTTPSQPSGIAPVEVTGRLLQARVTLGQQQTVVSNLTIEDDVQFREMRPPESRERPLLIHGDRLDAANLSGTGGTATITGRPARFEARGLGLTGTNIHVNRGTNRLWIDGPGQMDLPLTSDLEGQSLATPGVMTVDWRRRMEFDGRTARFEESVVAAGPQQQLHTQTMEVSLQRPIRFSDPKMNEPPQVEEVRCRGGVSVESRSFDKQRQLSSVDRMQVADMAVNVLGGALTAGGPGWFNHVGRGSDNASAFGAAIPVGLSNRATDPPGQADGAANPPQDTLICLHVKFQGSITGNLLSRQVTFHDQVRAAYAPVNNWEAILTTEDPDQLGPQGVTLRCDQLSVIEMLLPIGGRRARELEALGNAVVENTIFTARGNRITYAEAKDLLILEGDGRNNAELFRQLRVGDPASKAAAKKIWYWPKTKQAKFDGAQSLEIDQLQK